LYAVPYVWTEQYQAAVLELGMEDPLAEIAKAEVLIRSRKVELLQVAGTDSSELAAIARALRVLTLLRELEQKSDRFGIH